LDDETIAALVRQQKDQEQRAKQNLEEFNRWDPEAINEDYHMESNMFDYEEIKKAEFFGIKKYADSVYRGELTE
jgi:hypothetical protein